jgi:hypothetical protein
MLVVRFVSSQSFRLHFCAEWLGFNQEHSLASRPYTCLSEVEQRRLFVGLTSTTTVFQAPQEIVCVLLLASLLVWHS